MLAFELGLGAHLKGFVAIAKGYGVDRAVDALRAWGIRQALVNVGAVQGGFGWRVSRTPHRTDLFLDVRVPPTKEMAVARREALDLVRSLAERFPNHGVEGEVYVTALSVDEALVLGRARWQTAAVMAGAACHRPHRPPRGACDPRLPLGAESFS